MLTLNAVMRMLVSNETFTVNMPDELHTRFKIACTLDGKEMTEVILKFVEEFISKIEKRKLIVFLKKKK